MNLTVVAKYENKRKMFAKLRPDLQIKKGRYVSGA